MHSILRIIKNILAFIIFHEGIHQKFIMKKTFLLSFLSILLFVSVSAQNVGINNDGSTPNPSAMLDINNANKGLLIPRVMLTGTDESATVQSPALSFLVYNTTTHTGLKSVSPDYFSWN